MAASLSAWLHDEVKTQLDLGQSWLEEKNKRKAKFDRPSATVDRQWEGLYHDNGSCIDIVGPYSSEQLQVLVLKTTPLTITDGRHQTESSLTSACLNDLRARYPDCNVHVGAVLTVRKFTIRYTSYGPPRDKLRLILDTVSWLGENHSKVRVDLIEPLHHSEDIASTLRQLHRARVQEDDRCLRSQPKEEEDLHDGTYTMAGADEPLDEDASMNTQMPFGTQVQHPIRSRRHNDEVSFVGINRLEPVLAGNTQRAELKPRSGNSATEKQKQAQLLSLLKSVQPPAAPQAQSCDLANTTREPRRSEEHAATTSSRLRETPSKRANRERIEELMASSTQTPPDKGEKRMREIENESPSTHRSAKKTSFSENESRQSNVSEMETFAAECSWMQGLKFNRASSIVPEDQAYILQKPESWYKPPVGLRFPGANIPVQTLMTLSRLADEKAALEGATSSGSYNEADPSTASYPPTSAPQLEESESEEEASIPWSTSSEPPQRPTSPRQGLPPDSSNEEPQDAVESAVVQSSAIRGDLSPHSTLPASSNENEAELPPSSPPAPHADDDSDDDMELETSVPQALGEDLVVQEASRSAQNHIPRTESRSRSVVQVKETPYVKGKNGQQPVVTISPPTQESNRHLNNSSSASVVRGTYQEFSSSAVEGTKLDSFHKNHDKNQQDNTNIDFPTQLGEVQDLLSDHEAQDVSMFNLFVHDEPPPDLAFQADGQKQAHNTQTGTIQENAPAQPEPTPMSAQLPPKDSSSGEQAAPGPTEIAFVAPMQPERETSRQPSATPSLTKRKLETTPTRERKRPSKHKRLKIVSFGGGDSEALQQQRAESLRRSETERRKSSTSVESRHGSINNLSLQDTDTKMEDSDAKEVIKPQVEGSSAAVEGNMSPRHQSLYAAPSPMLRPSAAPHVAASITESISIDQTEQGAPRDHITHQGAPGDFPQLQQTQTQARPESPPKSHSEPQLEPRPVSAPLPDACQSSSMVPARADQAPSAAPVDVPTSLTVFETFKAAYPDYKGNVKHFKNQCTQMEELDQEDKMVPKWMWDDFVIRNQTDYKDYAIECIDSGEEAMPYIRFYKDTIRDAIYKKGVIETRAVLLKALQELGVQPRTVKTSTPQPPVQQVVQQPSHQSPRPPVRQSTHVRQSHLPLVQHSPRQPSQQSPRQPPQRQIQSPMPSPAQPAIEPPKKKPSRKSLPFPRPSDPILDRVNGTPRVRHSLPATSVRAAPSSNPALTPSVRLTASARPKRKTDFGDKLRQLAAELPSSTLEQGTGNEFRDWVKAHPRVTSTTGSTRVDSNKPWPSNLEVRPSVSDLPKKKIDVLSWTDEL